MKKLLPALLLLLSCTACVVTMEEPQTGRVRTEHVMDRLSETRFVPGTEDVPVYPGFRPVEDGEVVYDSGAGRIIKAQFEHNKITPSEVEKFYQTALVQLGWKQGEPNHYTRDQEKLTLEIVAHGAGTALYFTLEPSPMKEKLKPKKRPKSRR